MVDFPLPSLEQEGETLGNLFYLFSFFLSSCRIKGRGGSVGHSSISSPQPALCYCVVLLCCVIVLPDVLFIGDVVGCVQGDDGGGSSETSPNATRRL